MQPVMDRVAARWHELAGSCFTGRDGAAAELDRLADAYRAPGRHYHNLEHIDAMLVLSADHAERLHDPAAVDLAILYHDAVYSPTRKDNEKASADLARQQLTDLGVAPALIDKVARYIEATEHLGAGHLDSGAEPKEADTDLDHLLDFDLAILAAEPAAYDAYASAIRREYAIYPDLLYRPGRAKALRKLLDMPHLYRVPAMAHSWEPRARANLARELNQLGSR